MNLILAEDIKVGDRMYCFWTSFRCGSTVNGNFTVTNIKPLIRDKKYCHSLDEIGVVYQPVDHYLVATINLDYHEPMKLLLHKDDKLELLYREPK